MYLWRTEVVWKKRKFISQIFSPCLFLIKKSTYPASCQQCQSWIVLNKRCLKVKSWLWNDSFWCKNVATPNQPSFCSQWSKLFYSHIICNNFICVFWIVFVCERHNRTKVGYVSAWFASAHDSDEPWHIFLGHLWTLCSYFVFTLCFHLELGLVCVCVRSHCLRSEESLFMRIVSQCIQQVRMIETALTIMFPRWTKQRYRMQKKNKNTKTQTFTL